MALGTIPEYNFDDNTQREILSALWLDKESRIKYDELIQPKYFTNPMHIDLCRIIKDYRSRHEGKTMSVETLENEVWILCHGKNDAKNKLYDDYMKEVRLMQSPKMDIEYIRNFIRIFGRRQLMSEALLKAADILDNYSESQYADIIPMFKEAWETSEVIEGQVYDFFDANNIKERYLSYLEDDDVIERIPTGIESFDYTIGGGLGRTEMGIVVAPPGRGKTTFLINAGCGAIKAGKRVYHISMENNIKQVSRNYDLCLMGKRIEYFGYRVDDLESSEEANIRMWKLNKAINGIHSYLGGNLKITQYSARSVSTDKIRNDLDKFIENGEPIDLLIVDYGALLKNSSQTKYTDKRQSIEDIYEELRAIALDYNIAVWTAMQGNRASLSKKIVTQADLAECFAVANTSDVMVSLCQTKEEKVNRKMRLFLTKCRDSSSDLIFDGSIEYESKRLIFVDKAHMGDEPEDDEDEENWEGK